jgi:lipopolysaccharide assembly outer membrane protein LptD (OstA)
MKNLALATIASVAACSASFGLINLGEGQIDLKATGSVMHDSSITAQDSSPEDTILSLTTTLTYLRKSKSFDLSASVGVRVDEYLDNSEYSDENFFFDLAINPEAEFRTSRFQFSGNLILNTETTSNPNVGEIITTTLYGATGQLVYDPNRHYTVTADLSTTTRDPDHDDYYRTREQSAGVRIAVPINKDIAGLGGILMTQRNLDDPLAVDSDSYAYYTGLEGTVLTKLKGILMIGMQERSLDNGSDSTSPYLSASLTWDHSERTRMELVADQSLSTTISSYNTEIQNIGLSVVHKINRRWSCGGNINYSDTNYEFGLLPDRQDEEFRAGMQVSRQIGDWARATISLQYSDRSSSDPFYTYDRLRTGISLTATW